MNRSDLRISGFVHPLDDTLDIIHIVERRRISGIVYWCLLPRSIDNVRQSTMASWHWCILNALKTRRRDVFLSIEWMDYKEAVKSPSKITISHRQNRLYQFNPRPIKNNGWKKPLLPALAIMAAVLLCIHEVWSRYISFNLVVGKCLKKLKNMIHLRMPCQDESIVNPCSTEWNIHRCS